MEVPRHWRMKAQRYRLEGVRCTICGQFTFPPRPVCSHCTTQPEQIAGEALPVFLASTGLTGIESHMKYQITERLTR